MIILITDQTTLPDTLAATLPTPVPVIHFESVIEANAYFDNSAQKPTRHDIILVDARGNTTVVADCRHLCRQMPAHPLPLIAIIDQAADREVVFEAGADDYLLWPLIPAEVQTRLSNYLNYALYGFDGLLKTIHQMNSGASPHTLNRGVKTLADTFNAAAAWLLLPKPANPVEFELAGQFNLPLLYRRNPQLLIEGNQAHLALSNLTTDAPLMVDVVVWGEVDPAETNGLSYHLILPLTSDQKLIGLLTLAYHSRPLISTVEQKKLLILGQNIGSLLDMFHRQEESQVHAMQNALLVLITRVVDEQSDLYTTLSSTLELATPLFNASGSQIWLLTGDKQGLELAASLSRRFSTDTVNYRPKDRGLVGWVAAHNQSLLTPVAVDDPRFDPAVDTIDGGEQYALLAVPLNHRAKPIGVIAIHNEKNIPFTEQDRILLEGVAALTASVIANRQLWQERRDYMEERERLYSQMTQTERLVTVGRLTASLSHEINNPMQAIQGALNLALEELDRPAELTNYIQMSLNESRQVVQLVSRMRQLYRPQSEKPRLLNINALIQDAVAIGRQELKRKKVDLVIDLEARLPLTVAVGHQLQLVFVNLMLNLGDVIGMAGQGVLRIRSRALPKVIQIAFCSDAAALDIERWHKTLQLEPQQKMAEVNFGTAMSHEIIAAHHGAICFKQHDQEVSWLIEIPISTSEN
ncbi:MAG: GAF domain-containing protein [Anaerolineaceae bacterium]|nr:GAF domain-containing protein [Anaerolineaceae bacterium]MCB9098092.1 GAF domain-containing protein [Anaerolineales bacterium]